MYSFEEQSRTIHGMVEEYHAVVQDLAYTMEFLGSESWGNDDDAVAVAEWENDLEACVALEREAIKIGAKIERYVRG